MKFSEITKTVVAFLGLLVTNAVASLMESGEPWPTNGGQWARWAISTIVGTLGVYGLPNTTKEPEVAATQSVRLKKGVSPRAGGVTPAA